MSQEATHKTLAEVEAEHIRTVVEYHHGNMSAAARTLGIDRRTLYRKAPRLDLHPAGKPGRPSKNVMYLQRRVVELEQRLAKHEGVGRPLSYEETFAKLWSEWVAAHPRCTPAQHDAGFLDCQRRAREALGIPELHVGPRP